MNKKSSLKTDPEILKIGGQKISRGTRKEVSLSLPDLYDGTALEIPVKVIRGAKPGPTLFISAAIHGDEINGIEIIRRLLKRKELATIKGTLILIPIVNVFGFNFKSRYLPDKRDLNRCFPGRRDGSLASRIAHIFMKEIVSKSTHGIDLHTGSNHRTNLPHIRASLDDENTKQLAESFGVPVVINSKLRDGSLRESARKKSVKMLLFEGGESLRFEEKVIKIGLNGCLSVMRKIGMIDESRKGKSKGHIFIADSSFWIRAPKSGLVSMKKRIGDKVLAGDIIARISDPLGNEGIVMRAEEDGILVGSSLIPLVNEGDAIFHLATFSCSHVVEEALLNHEMDLG